ncbi:DUF732 domain-containing protein [Microbacterium sp. Ag1]|uniref:DUF732 domain-containing protein n=1 Tax=Microbacterium sp. Ag1 TaxID=1643443 RepID=UPI000629B360|nr:DUF732 domain-containing protein [Microbacterium sp. Ag1]KKX97745.1 hypothetical protein AAY78_11180 [Microbacterium sp. Ag1]
MPKITATTLTVAALILLALTGCAGNATDERVAPAAVETTEPLVAETPAAESEAPATPDQLFVDRVRAELPDDTVIPNATDEQLIAAAGEACEQMNAGVDFSAVDVVDGEIPNGLDIRESSATIAAAAKDIYCPQGY